MKKSLIMEFFSPGTICQCNLFNSNKAKIKLVRRLNSLCEFPRGGDCPIGLGAGAFAFGVTNGNAYGEYGFRVVLTPNP